MSFNLNSRSARGARIEYRWALRRKFRRGAKKNFPNLNIAAVESGRSAAENEASPGSASPRAAALQRADTSKQTTRAGQNFDGGAAC